jgi:high-affinity Fe2+/Pb2+ permease
MNNLIWLLRASRWARQPPSARMVKLVLAIVAAGLIILALEWLDLWPDWAQMQNGRGLRLPR